MKTKLRFLKSKRNVKLYLHNKTDVKTTFLFKLTIPIRHHLWHLSTK